MIITLAYLCLLVFVGFVALCVFVGSVRRGPVEVVALSLALGMGVVPLLLMWASMLGTAPRVHHLFIITMAVAIVGAVCLWFGRFVSVRLPELPGKRDSITLACAIWIAVCFAALCRFALPYRAHDIDAWSIWGLKANVVVSEPLSPRPAYFTTLPLSYSHLDYPLLLPFLSAGLFGVPWEMDDRVMLMLHVAMYLAVVMLAYSTARLPRRGGGISPPLHCDQSEQAGASRPRHGCSESDLVQTRAGSMLIAALVASVPALIRWSGAGDADVMLTMFVSGAVLSLMRSDMLLVGMFIALGAMTKHEGVMIGVVVILVALAMGVLRRRQALAGAALAILLYLPWFVWSRGIPQTHENYLARLRPGIVLENLHRIGPILRELCRQIGNLEVWAGIWMVLIAVSVVGFRSWKRRDVQLLWLIFALQLLGYVLIYVITPWDLNELLPMTTHRIFLHFLPVVTGLIVLQMPPLGGTITGSTDLTIKDHS